MFNIPTVTIASRSLAVAESSVTLNVDTSAVSWTPRHLVLRVNGFTTSASEVALRFNGDSGSNYNRQMVRGQGTAKAALQVLAETSYKFGSMGTSLTTPSGGEVLISDALSTRGLKNAVSYTGYQGEGEFVSFLGRWDSTAAITSVTFINTGSGDFGAGTTFELCVVDESFNVDQAGDGEEILTGTGAFSSVTIPDGDGDIVHIANIRSGRGNAGDNLILFFNGDETATNYDAQFMSGNGSSFTAYHRDDAVIGYSPASLSQAYCFGLTVAVTQNYANASNDKHTDVFGGFIRSAADSAAAYNSVITPVSRRWGSTAAITSTQFESQQTDESLVGSMVSTYVVPKNLIERQEISGDTAAITFSSIPQTYDHLELSVYAKADHNSIYGAEVYCEFNGDTTATNYWTQRLYGRGTTTAALSQNYQPIGQLASDNSDTNIFGGITSTIYNYTKTDRHKHYLSSSGNPRGDSTAQVMLRSNRWADTDAITSIRIYPQSSTNFVAGSVFELSGIKKPSSASAAGDMTSVNGVAVANITAVN